MGWKVELDVEKGFIHTVYSGTVTKDDILASMKETLKIIEGKGPQKFLSEWINATSLLSAMEIFAIPDEWDTSEVSRKNVLALVTQTDAGSIEDSKFYENICQNRGWRVRVFTQRDDALKWLEEQKIAEAKKA